MGSVWGGVGGLRLFLNSFLKLLFFFFMEIISHGALGAYGNNKEMQFPAINSCKMERSRDQEIEGEAKQRRRVRTATRPEAGAGENISLSCGKVSWRWKKKTVEKVDLHSAVVSCWCSCCCCKQSERAPQKLLLSTMALWPKCYEAQHVPMLTCRYYWRELDRGVCVCVCEEFVFAAFGRFSIGVTASFLILTGSEWHLSQHLSAIRVPQRLSHMTSFHLGEKFCSFAH